MTTFVKDPAAELDYAFDWTAWLADGEAITTYTITPATGITLDSDSEASGIVTAWLSGGTAGTSYRVVCQVVTDQGRTDERSIFLSVKER